MDNELETLRPEVRDSLRILEAHCEGPEFWLTPNVQDIRAELLRLADENNRMRGITETLDVEGHRRAERAEAELAALKARIANAPRCTLRRGDHMLQVDGPLRHGDTVALV
jgi:hypothetical protein